ncbi:hypothetical protein AWC38_SpisGene21989 [Stylophora pistillata]|uniref:C2H2-type domain-containing protein n=1 Tax=Stylophora pistillata TaxID=50429 RepID=A0A2B4RAQ3_STYPI|nr:hypothetical protein AWC38_SpisGene21989 [Stylophora pistillata]
MMAVLSKTLEATTDRSDQHISYMEEISFIQNKLFFETFPAAIVKLRASCAMSSCWEIQYLLTLNLHRKMAVLDSVNHTRMAVPVFESLKEYFKKINLKDTKVIQHLAVFKTAITSLCFHDNRSKETIFSRAFVNRYEYKIKEKLSTRYSDGDEMPVTWKGNQPAEFIPSVSLPVLRLRGGANGDDEKWLCDICGKLLVSKRNLDVHMDSAHATDPDFTCVTLPDGLSKWKCSLCGSLLSSKQRVISHLIKTHGKTNLGEKEHQQTLNSRTRLWRRKCSANGSFVQGQNSSTAYLEENLSFNSEHCSAISNESPRQEDASFVSSFYQSISGKEYLHFLAHNSTCDAEISRQSSHCYNKGNSAQSVVTHCPASENLYCDPVICVDVTYSSDSDCSAASCTDYSSSETEQSTSSSESDSGDQETDLVSDTSVDMTPSLVSEKEKLSILILSYIAKHKLSGSASVDLLDLLKFIAPKDNTLLSLTLSEIKETLGDCIVNVFDYCGKCFSIFPKDESVYRCNTTDNGGNQCADLRFGGNLGNQAKKQRNLYFVTVSIEQQLTKLLERNSIWMKIQQYKDTPNCSSNIRDIVDGTVYRKFKEPGGFLSNKANLTLLFNTDGIPLYKSSKVNIWPVFLAINELPPEERFAKKNMILWGLWQGKGKPRFSTFFEVFTDDLIRLKCKGFTISEKCSPKVMLALGTTDLQGKAYLMYMSHHNGINGCITCEEEGFVTKQGKGHVRCYPFKDPPAPLRTSESVVENSLSAMESGRRVRGFHDVTPLAKLPWFDLVLGIVPDYMHGVLLGVTKQLLNLWLSSSKHKKPWFIGHKTKTIDKRLKEMKPPDFIQRLPRQLETSRAYFKASELQAWLLFYSIPCLIDILPEKYLQHFACLVEGIYILLGDNITPDLLSLARDVLFSFYRDHQVLYGDSNCSLNVHNIGAHLVTYVQAWGPLWAWSCFPFEDLNGALLESVHGTGNQCRQLIWMMIYERMRKHCRFAVLVEHNGGNYMAFVEYFLFESNVKTVFAVIKPIILDFENPFLVCDKAKHLLRVAGEDDKYTVVAVDCILEKIIYLSGNPNNSIKYLSVKFALHDVRPQKQPFSRFQREVLMEYCNAGFMNDGEHSMALH